MAMSLVSARDVSRLSLNFFKVFFLLGLSLVLVTGCQKKSGPAAATGGSGGSTTNDGEIDYQVSGTIADDEEPVDFVESIASVEISGVNLSSSTAKFNISAFYLSPLGKKTLVYQGTSDSNRFSFRSKVPKHLIVIEAVRVNDGGKFAGLLPPPMRSLLAKLRITRTSSIAAKMASIIADKAASGNAVAQSALATNSVSVADVLTAAQSVRRTVDEQQSKGSGSAIDLTALAIKLAEKSNERLSALVAEGQSAESVSANISEKTYESVFGENAETTPPGVLAHRTNLDLGTSTAATKDVAYEAIKALGTDSAKIVDEAFRVDATTYREAYSVTAAVAAESTVAGQFSIKFDACQASISNCAAVAYTPPQPSSGGSSGGSTTGSSTTGSSTLPVITINTQPSNQTAANGGASFSVSVSVTQGAVLSYQWQKQESGSGSFTNVSGAASSTLVLSSLTNAADNGDVYRVVVSATGGATSVTSSTGALTVPPVITVPDAPSSVTGTAGDTQVSLTWNAPASNGGAAITDYVIQYSSNGGTNWTTFNDGTSTNTSAAVSGLTNGTSYIFKVAATNSAGTGSYSSNSSSVTPAASNNNPCSNSVSPQRPNDCYNEGVAPNYAQDLPIGSERKGPLDVTMTLQYANGADGFKIWKEKSGTKILNATGLVSNGWQKTLNRVGNALSASDFTTSSNIAGRVCPPNVFINHDLMTAADRCLYFDNGSSVQRLDAAGTSTFETSDWLQAWSRPLTGRGIGSSFYEGNIKTCADKGMRLPALYETSISEAAAKASTMGSPGEYLPTGDSITAVWAENNGVPTNSMNWTATAHVPDANYFWNWHGTGGGNSSFSDTIAARCVVPSHSKTEDPPPPPIITEVPAPPSPPPSTSGSFCAFGSGVMGGWTYTNATKAECVAVGLDTCGDIPDNALCGCGHPHSAPSCTEYYMGPTNPSLPTGVAGAVSQEQCPDALLNAAKQINSSTGCSEFASQNPGFEIRWIQK
jgi:hypothetical protein